MARFEEPTGNDNTEVIDDIIDTVRSRVGREDFRTGQVHEAEPLSPETVTQDVGRELGSLLGRAKVVSETTTAVEKGRRAQYGNDTREATVNMATSTTTQVIEARKPHIKQTAAVRTSHTVRTKTPDQPSWDKQSEADIIETKSAWVDGKGAKETEIVRTVHFDDQGGVTVRQSRKGAYGLEVHEKSWTTRKPEEADVARRIAAAVTKRTRHAITSKPAKVSDRDLGIAQARAVVQKMRNKPQQVPNQARYEDY